MLAGCLLGLVPAGMVPAKAMTRGADMAEAARGAGVFGDWRNPHGSLIVRTSACPSGLCGTIIWASAEAEKDGRDAGVSTLVGLRLLEDYRPAGGGAWAGRVYVADMGRSFSSRIRLTGRDELTISGCLIGTFLCRSQIWRRTA